VPPSAYLRSLRDQLSTLLTRTPAHAGMTALVQQLPEVARPTDRLLRVERRLPRRAQNVIPITSTTPAYLAAPLPPFVLAAATAARRSGRPGGWAL
jgi:hypothetical protein